MIFMPQLREAYNRYAKFYSSKVREISNKYAKGNEESTSALEYFDLEQPNIVNTKCYLEAPSVTDFEKERILLSFLTNTFSVLCLRFQLEELENLLLAGLGVARKFLEIKIEAKLSRYLGSTFYMEGKYKQSINFFNKSIIISKRLNLLYSLKIAYSELGLTLHALHKYQEALNIYEQALAIKIQGNDSKIVGRIYGNMGMAYFELKMYENALEMYNNRIKIAVDIGDIRGQANGNFNIGRFLLQFNYCEKAMHYFETSLKFFSSIGDKQGVSKTFWELGKIYEQLGNLHKAINLFQNSQSIYFYPNKSIVTKMDQKIKNLLKIINEKDN